MFNGSSKIIICPGNTFSTTSVKFFATGLALPFCKHSTQGSFLEFIALRLQAGADDS